MGLVRRCLAVGCLIVASLIAACSPGDDAAQRQKVEQIVRETLEKNPDIVLKALKVLQEQREAAEREAMRDVVGQLKKPLHDEAPRLIAGNPDGDVTIVEFFDYRCGYCKQVFPSLMTLLKDDGKVRVIFKEFPVLGEASRLASRAALASEAQGKYLPFHIALMEYRGQLNEEAIFKIADGVGLDVKKLSQDMDDPAIDEALARSAKLGQALDLSGTPAFIIGQTIVPGAISLSDIKKFVAEERARKG